MKRARRRKSFIRWVAVEDFTNTLQSIDAEFFRRVHTSAHWAKRDSTIGKAAKVCITIEEMK